MYGKNENFLNFQNFQILFQWNMTQLLIVFLTRSHSLIFMNIVSRNLKSVWSVTQNNLTTLLYFVTHSLSCNQSLCTGKKAEGSISFKSTEWVADSHQFKTNTSFTIKSFSIVPHFFQVFAFFLWEFSRLNNIKNNQTFLSQSSNPLLNTFPL